MKAITLTQPWATLVAIGAKKIETRSWGTKYRGPLAIHAAQRFPAWAKDVCVQEPFFRVLKQFGIVGRMIHGDAFIRMGGLPTGVIVATCDLVNCVRIGSVDRSYPMLAIDAILWDGKTDYEINTYAFPPDEPEESFGNYTIGRFAWILRNVMMLPEPIPAKGKLGLWEWKGG